MNFSQLNRPQFIQQLAETEYDLLVIGGGITGCGIALDAALRGIKVALIEKNDFGFGTSSRSTKLIHGGLRYLKQMEIKLVKDVGRERAIVYRNARHVVIPEKMLLPIVKNGSLGKQSSSLGLFVYDVLAGVKSAERRRMLSKEETLAAEPLLTENDLIGGGLYYEYRTDDSRLVIELGKSAFEEGAVLLNYCSADSFIKDKEGKVTGVNALDTIGKNTIAIRAKKVVNAAGPWVDELRKEDNSLKGKRLQLTKGVHIVFPYSKLPLKQAAYFDVGDGRMIFAIPRNGITYVGTTDTVYNQDINRPRTSKADVEYILAATNKIFPKAKLTQADIESSWAGLRPLIHEDGKSPSELSRKDEIIISDSGLISIAGGKLTGFRLMAEKVVDIVARTLVLKKNACLTANYRLSGGKFESEEDVTNSFNQLKAIGKEYNTVRLETLFQRYGSNLKQVLENATAFPSHAADERLWLGELKYVIDNEMVYTPEDFFIRRSGNVFFNRPASAAYIATANKILADTFKWTGSEQQQHLETVNAEFEELVTFQ